MTKKTNKAANKEEANGQASKAPWSPEEDVVLIQLVEKIGAQKWSMISDYLPAR